MVAGLAFLSKKSWHTKNIANQEKVWVAEQRKEQEEAKAKELAKQIQQEREQEELDKIAGKKSARIDRGIDWMYHGQQKNSEIAQEDAAKKNEDYLLGKAYVPEGGAVGDFHAGANAKEGVNAVLEAKKPAAVEPVYHEPSVAERNEAFRHRHEDPMFAVAMQAKHKQDEYRKKKELYERVVGPTADSDDDRRAHKREKKHKKTKKKHRKRRHYHSSDEESSSVHDHRKRHRRSRTPDSYEDRRRRRRPSRSRSPEPDREYQHARRHRDDRRHHHHHGRRSESNDEEDSSYRRRDDRREVTRHVKAPPPSYRNERPHDKKEGYGLQGATSSSSRSTGDLGPDRDLLLKKRREREVEKERNLHRPSARRTEEERLAALRDMEQTARRYHDHRGQRPVEQQQEEEETSGTRQASAAFLQSVVRKAHGVTDGSVGLHERIAQNRSTNQRLHDDFM